MVRIRGVWGRRSSPNLDVNTKQGDNMSALTEIATEEFSFVLNADQADALDDVLTAWELQHYISQEPGSQGDGTSEMYITARHFLYNSLNFDNHKWLMNKINA